MRGMLSEKGEELKELCDSAALAVASAIGGLVGDPEGGVMVTMGADGTPTKRIDRAAEDAVFSKLKDSGLGFRVLSEEIGEVTIGDRPDYFLHLDPLDGTFNAVRGIPFYSLSMYLATDGCRLGYVYDIARSVRYFAEAGRGAFSEGASGRVAIAVSKTSNIKDFSISAYTLRPNTSRIVRVGDTVRRMRNLGSLSLELSFVASGRLDAFVDVRGRLRVVDAAAGMLLIKEAGGRVTDSIGRQISLDCNMWQRIDLIGSSGLLHGELLDLVGGGGD